MANDIKKVCHIQIAKDCKGKIRKFLGNNPTIVVIPVEPKVRAKDRLKLKIQVSG